MENNFSTELKTILSENSNGLNEVKIDYVDYYVYSREGGEENIGASGSISIDIFINQIVENNIAESTLKGIKRELEEIDKNWSNKDSSMFAEFDIQQEKLDVIKGYTPEMFDDGVLGIYLDV